MFGSYTSVGCGDRAQNSRCRFMIAQVLFFATVGLYGLATGVFFAWVLRRGVRSQTVGRWVLAVALAAHLGAIGASCLHGLHPLLDTAGALSLTAWLLVVAYFALRLRWRVDAVGAIVAPLAMTLVGLGRLVPRGQGGGEGVAETLGRLHLTMVSLGVAAFALAAIFALLYLIQDAALRGKRMGLLHRLTPPLATLDNVAGRLVAVAFPVFTLAVISGVFWMRALPERPDLRAEYAVSGVVWLIFGGLLLARHTVGLSGRRAALLNVAGFVMVVAVLAIYTVRRVWGT